MNGRIWASLAGILIFIGVMWSLFSITQINETERGVLKRGGKIVEILQPGLNVAHFPLYTVDVLSIQQDTNKFSEVVSKTIDEQVVHSEISVTYKLKNDDESISEFYRNFQTMNNFLDKILRRNITNQLQIVMGKHTIQDTVRKKEELDALYLSYMKKSLRDTPVEVLSVQIESIRPSQQYTQTIELLKKAEQETKTREQNLKTAKAEADIVRTKAQAEADQELIKRTAEAEGIRAIGEAEAFKIEAMNKALFSNGDPDKVIEYTRAMQWNGVMPSTLLGSGSDASFILDTRNK